MFKIRQVFNEKVQEFETANVQVESTNEEETTEEKTTSELKENGTGVRGVSSMRSTVQNTVRSNNSGMSNSMKPTNFEDGYKSDLY